MALSISETLQRLQTALPLSGAKGPKTATADLEVRHYAPGIACFGGGLVMGVSMVMKVPK